jgi:transcription initiation factor TFIIE subunit alpha
LQSSGYTRAINKFSESNNRHRIKVDSPLVLIKAEEFQKLFFVDDETLRNVAALFGEDAVRVVEVLKEVYEIMDNGIADQTQIRLNMVRKILYRLYDHSIVALRQSRDKETGWFIFNWRLQLDQLEGFILNQKRRVSEKLEIRLEHEKTHEFYTCQTPGCKRFPFEDAFKFLFKCPVCDKPMTYLNNNWIIKTLTKKIKQIKEELSKKDSIISTVSTEAEAKADEEFEDEW